MDVVDVTPVSSSSRSVAFPGPAPTLRLVRRAQAAAPPPELDAGQRAVVEHAGGPLLVVAGPGTGKTTTLVESVVARIAAGVHPERILVLTFGRKAAAELRERITVRLWRTIREPLARTFHSYAFGVLRREAARRGEPAPRLLSGPEQDLVIRELLRGDTAGAGGRRGSRWPPALRAALGTRGFAQELRDLLLRCTERGLDAVALDQLGNRHGRDDWRAAAGFLRQYAEVSALAAPAAYDPAELIRAVLDRMLDPHDELRDRERAAYDWVFVDEFQDTDPSQAELLGGLVPPGGNLVVVGDPHQSIYAFRGTDVRCIERFPEAFRARDGSPAPVIALRTCRRSAPVVLDVGRHIARRLPSVRAAHDLQALPGRAAGSVDVLVAATASAEAALVAGVLRRAHLVDGVAWSRMAVLVRSTLGRLAVLRRALLAAGVPVAVAGGDLPLAEQPGLRPLIDLLRIGMRPDKLDEDTAAALLTSSVGGLDPVGLRRLRRELRQLELAAGGTRASGRLLVDALGDPRPLTMTSTAVRVPALRLARLLETVRAAAEQPGATAEGVLWTAWDGSGLAARWQAASLLGGPRGAVADRDLDAVTALFEAAARFVDRLPKAGPQSFLAHICDQQIPGDSVAARAPRGEVVRVLTAHAAKGLEWDLVVVAGVQEGVWPDLRPRGSLLGSERLVDLVAVGEDVPGSALPRRLAEERRLFYVAVTRARERLVVTAVADRDDGGQPSRFLTEVPLRADDGCLVLAHHVSGARVPAQDTTLGELRRTLPMSTLLPRLSAVSRDTRQPVETRQRAHDLHCALRGLTRSLDPASLVAELRAVLTTPGVSWSLRRVAAAQLARLAHAHVPGADPSEWYAARPLSDDRALRDPGGLVVISPSRVERFVECELRWLLETIGGGGPGSASQAVGTLVHALAATTDDPELRAPDALLAQLRRRWEAMDLGSPWYTAQQLRRAEGMIRRFLSWLDDNPRTLVGTELDFSVELPVTVEGRQITARVAGRVDRLERDSTGRGFVVDLKTGSRRPADEDLATHPQLAAYQVAVELGAFADHHVTASAGASLLQLGGAANASYRDQRQPALAQAEDPDWARRLLARVAMGMAGAAFRARENALCDRCPVRPSCPVHDDGRAVTE